MTVTNNRRIPYSVKLLYSAFVAIVVPLYWVTYSPWNFLYFCDIALLVTAAAIWMESPLLISMQAVAIVAPQLLWVVDLLCRVVGGVEITGVTSYMLNESIPLYLRGPFAISRMVAVPPAVVGVAIGLRSSSARSPVRSRNRDLVDFLSFRSGTATFRHRSEPCGQYQLRLRLH